MSFHVQQRSSRSNSPDKLTAMKYFTREEHNRANSSDQREVAASHEAFQRSCELYYTQLEKLKARLPDAWTFFDKMRLHDGTLLTLRIGDDIDKLFPTYPSLLVNNRRIGCCLTFQARSPGI
jgi:hypothetical protein